MNVLILGGDGYLGWPTAMDLVAKGHNVLVVDNYLRRNLSIETRSENLFSIPNLHDRVELFKSLTECKIEVKIFDCCDYQLLSQTIRDFKPDALVHYAEQPSAPYSMIGHSEAKLTFDNNLKATFNVIWAVKEFAPQCHIVKLGTMGEYGTPNIDIEEGWLDVNHKGRSHKFLYPRQASSLYHTTTVLDTDLLWFYVRTYGLRVTDLMQGPVYGFVTKESDLDSRLYPHFNYDDIFGTVVNRFMIQAICGIPLTVYGKGGQTRGYLNINDTLQCIDLAVNNPPSAGVMNIYNQFTELLTVTEIAEIVRKASGELGIDCSVQSIENPRKEMEEHYYNAKHTGLIELGLKPHYLTHDVACEMMSKLLDYSDSIDIRKIMPRVRWASS